MKFELASTIYNWLKIITVNKSRMMTKLYVVQPKLVSCPKTIDSQYRKPVLIQIWCQQISILKENTVYFPYIFFFFVSKVVALPLCNHNIYSIAHFIYFINSFYVMMFYIRLLFVTKVFFLLLLIQIKESWITMR